MAEIPEHLLKRSRDRRAALGLGGDDAGEGAQPAAATPATTAAAAAPAAPAAPAGRGKAVAPAAPPPPKPDSPVVAAYKRRKRIPFWAMLALSMLPIWALMYARAMTTQAEIATGPLAIGEETYSGCESCHNADGSGSVGYGFTNGEVLLTFPHIEDQVRWVYFGTDGYNAAGIQVYGNPDREGGPHVTGTRGNMPGQGTSLSGAELLGVVCHERYDLGGADKTGDYLEEFEKWCSEESAIFADLEAGGAILTLSDRFKDVLPIGPEPAPGLPPGEPAG